MPSRLSLAFFLCALGAGAGALAADEPEKRAPRLRPTIDATDMGPDDYALRYYAALNQTGRVDAEISRLQRLYPGWETPADLYKQSDSVVDETPFWALFSADKIDELRAAIDAKQRELPNWKPSADLLEKIRRKDLRLKITSFWKDGNWQDLADYVKRQDLSGLDEEVDLLWTVAEAFARTKQVSDAVAVYKAILASSKDKAIRIATLQKGMASLRMTDVETLIAAYPAQNAADLKEMTVDVARARMAAFLHDERREEVQADDLAAFERYAKESRDPNQLGLVAWYDYKRRDFRAALEWFKLAIGGGGDAMIAHGLAHTLRALDLLRDAEEVSYAWRGPLVNNVILFIDLLERELTREVPPFIEADRLARYAKVTMEVASGEGAQALAWYAYNSCQTEVALFWFERAAAWYPKDGSIYGYALTLSRLRKSKEFFELANRYDGLHPKIIEILFPDGYYHPPTPCDRKGGAAKLHGPPTRGAGFIAPGPATIPGAPPNYDPSAYVAYSEQKNSSDLTLIAPRETLLARALKNIKGKFPAAVSVENPLRFRPLSDPAPLATQAPSLRRDPAEGPAGLVARRVPGVGAMPYETYGFSLLPGWNGLEAPSSPPASKQIAPTGTQWASEDADPARAGVAALARTQAPTAGLAAPVPAPATLGQPLQPQRAAGPALVAPAVSTPNAPQSYGAAPSAGLYPNQPAARHP